MPHTPTRLHILSDLHLGNAPFEHPAADADIVILAGDISRPAQALTWARQFEQPVLYVAGNHEFYGSSIGATLNALRAGTAGTSIHFLEQGSCVINGIRFLGTSLWTDFNLFDAPDAREQAIEQAVALIRDFSMIRSEDPAQGPLQPGEMEDLYARSKRWLAGELDKPFDGPTVVVTHHAPSTRSIHPRFNDSLLNTCFVSDCEHLMGGDRVRLWIHGHTHDCFDYTVNGTRVVCNPRGYVLHGTPENPGFDPRRVITV
jgi:predicted phosphodiesterase